MSCDIDFEDFDSFFNMRRQFWEKSRDKASVEKDRSGTIDQRFQVRWGLLQESERKRWIAEASGS